MKYQSFLFATFVFAIFSLSSCGSDKSASDNKDPQEEPFREDDIDINIESEGDVDLSGLKESIDELEDKLNEMKKEGGKETVDFRDLKEMMPKRIAGMDRTEHSGEKAGAFGFNIATANAIYEDGDQRLEVSIVDVGGIGSAVASMASWSNLEVDRESKNGYERTITIDGHKAYEKYDSKREEGETNLLIDDRFIVSIKGRNVSERDMTKARKAIDIDDLEKLVK